MNRSKEPGQASALALGALDVLPDAVLVCDGETRIVLANEAAQQLLGWSCDQLAGQRVDMCLIDHGCRHRLSQAGFASAPAGSVDAPVRRKDGARLDLRIEWRAMGTAMAGGFVVTLRMQEPRADSHAEAEAQRQASAQLAALFEHTPVAISVVDTEQKIVLVNKVTADLYGQDPAVFVGMDIVDLAGFWPEFGKVVQAGLEVIASGKAQYTSAVWNPPEGAEPVIYDIVCFPIRDSQDAVIQVGLFMLDVTAQKQAEAALAEREAMLSSLFEHVSVRIAIITADQQIVLVNRRVAEEAGVPENFFVGKDVSLLRGYWTNFDSIVAMGNEVLADGVSRSLIGTWDHPDSSRAGVYKVQLFPILGRDGQIDQIGVFMVDVTEQKASEAALAEREAQLTALIEHMPAGISLFDRDHRLVLLNSEPARYLTQPKDQLIGSHVSIFQPLWDDYEVLLAAGEAVLADGQPRQLTLPFRVPGRAEPILYEIVCFPVLSSIGEVAQLGLFLRDITEQQRSHEELVNSREALHQSEKLAALGQMLAGVAHELNNPLATVVLRSAMLEEKLVGTPHVASLQKLGEAADRCARIVKTFLAMARQTGPQRQLAQLGTLIEAAVAMTEYWLTSSDIALDCHIAAGLPDIAVDEDQIVQVISNLLVNAQHALGARAADRRIAIRAGVSNGRAFVEVADNGPGIPAANFARIFDPFFTTKAVGHGTGLGLSVCRNVALGHGGDLAVSDTPGGGATFRLTLPIASEAMLAAPTAAPASAAAQARGRLMVVDDEPDVLQSMAECLAPLGIEVVLASNGREALDLAGSEHFDAVISDVTMPVMGGIALLDQLSQRHPQLAAAFALMTGDVFHPDLRPIRESGACQIIEKPFNPLAIREVAAHLIQSGSEK